MDNSTSARHRLERAKLLFENILLHAGNLETGYSDYYGEIQSHISPSKKVLGRTLNVGNYEKESFTPKKIEKNYHHASSSSSRIRAPSSNQEEEYSKIGDQEKDLMIISLQEEVNRLKKKLDEVLECAENTVTELHIQQGAAMTDFTAEKEYLAAANFELQQENKRLNSLFLIAKKELEMERNHLLKAVRCLDRLRLRGRELSKGPSDKNIIKDLKLYIGSYSSGVGASEKDSMRNYHHSISPGRRGR